ncbi:MAG: transporter substrate-binding domain-containing protein [Stagnimonas sp.]|nr:transporter substrate-binding domain-containing protein [Stagnimonas sp.]
MKRWLCVLLAAVLLPAAAQSPPEEIARLQLTAEQQAVLAAHPKLRLGVETDWAPIEFIDADGRYSGVVSSYMRALEDRLGIQFEIVHKHSFSEMLSAFERGEIDVLSAITRTDARAQSMRFSVPYIYFTDGIIVRSDEPYIERLRDFPAGRRLAVVEGYSSNASAASKNPQLVSIPVRTSEEALFAVSTGRADIAVASLAVAYHLTQNKGLTNLRVAANFDEQQGSMAIAVRPGLQALVPIFNAVLDSIPQEQRNAMREEWTHVQIDRGVARGTVLWWTVAALAGFAVLAAWVILLLSQQRRRTQLLHRAEEAEMQFRAMIDAMPAIFWTLRIERGRPPLFTFYGDRPDDLNAALPRERDISFEEGTQFMLDEERQQLRDLLDAHGETLSTFQREHRLRSPQPGGGIGWALSQGVPRKDKAGITWHGCTLDITNRKTLEADLERSRSQLQELAAGVPGALWQFKREADGRQYYSYLSEGIVDITGRTPEQTNQLMMDKSFAAVHPDDHHLVRQLLQRAPNEPGIAEARYRLRTAQGEWKWVQVAARAMPVGPDGVLVWNGVTLDATSIVETETALRFERQRLQDLADSLPGALWRLRRTTEGTFKFVYVSEGVVNLAGRTAAEIMAGQVQPFDEILPEYRARAQAVMEASVGSGAPIEMEYPVHSASGGVEWLYVRGNLRVEQGEPVWTGVLLNVSERHRLQEQLADVSNRIEDIAANFPGGIFQVHQKPDFEARFTYASEGVAKLAGPMPLAADGREQLEAFANVHPDDREHVRATCRSLVCDGSSTQLDFRTLHADGKARWVHCAMTARAHPESGILVNGLMLDAESTKQLEADLHAARDRAEAASRTKSRFLANMSHEIRTPMNAVIGLAHIAMTSETNPVQAERIGKIHKAGKALLKLLNDILEYSKLDAGKFTPTVAPFDLREMKESLRLFCAHAAEAKGLQFEIDSPADLNMHWLGDATRIQQVLLNLLTNAIKFTDAGHVKLVVRPLSDTLRGLRFKVCDTGIGMSATEVKRVFEAFEQASGDIERRHGGSGLGLSISQELVHALNGRISVESTPGKGTEFMVDLPLRAAASTPATKPQGDVDSRLQRLATQLQQRDSTGARNSLSALRMVLIPQGRDGELHALERLLAGFDIEAAQIELMRLAARWGVSIL